jgi:hypothetical protein
MGVVAWLQIGSAICALAAAVFWFLSATTPPPMTYQGMEHFPGWFKKTVLFNRWAAGFAGLSALLAGGATLTPWLV